MTRPHHDSSAGPSISRRTFAFSLAAGTVGMMAGCQMHHTMPHSAPALEPIPANSFKVTQYALLPVENDPATDIYLRENLLIVYSQKHIAYVLDRDALTLKWVVPISGPGTKIRPPVVLKDFVVFPTISSLEVFDPYGKKHRSVSTRGLALRSGAVGTGARVYFGGDARGGGRVECIDLNGSQYQSASVLWPLATRGGISATPAVQQSILYIGDDNGIVYAANADTRAAVWPLKEEGHDENVFTTAGPIRADLKADETGVYVASMDTKLYCLGRTDGRIQWRYFAGTPLLHAPHLTATSVYLYVDEVGLVAIDKQKGDPNRAPRWTIKDALSVLAEDERHVYLESTDHSILAVDVKTGQIRFRSKHKGYTFATTPKGNAIYSVSKDGTVRTIMPVMSAGSVGEIA